MMEVIRTDTLDAALAQAGLSCPQAVELAPGRFTRFDDPQGGKGNKAAWCRPFEDSKGAVFGCWRTGESWTWQKHHDGPAPSRADIEQFRQQAARARQEADDAREAAYKEAAEKAQGRWGKAQPAQDHPYLTLKAIEAHGCRVEGDCLLVPVLNDQEAIQSLQTIGPDGGKRFLIGGKMAGGRFWIGKPGPVLVLAEGFATGAAVHEATGLPVCVAFNAGNLLAVAQDIRKAHPQARITLAADNDIHDKRPNVGRQKAQEAAHAIRGTVALPDLAGRACDWWDVRHELGDDALKTVFTPTPRFRLLGRDDLCRLPDLEWLVNDVLPMAGIGLVIGQSGAGKSFVAIDLLARVALGMPWFGHPTKAHKTVYTALEGRAGIKRRIEAWERQNSREVPSGFSVVLDTLKLTEQDDVHDLATAILNAGGEGGLIIIDTLAQASPGIDENSSSDMGLVIEALQRLQALTGGLVLGVHHMGKDTARGARGHSSLYAACDAVIATTKAGDLITVSTHGEAGGKSKDAEPVEHAAMLERVVLRTLADGHEIAGACVVESNAAPVKLPKEPKGGNTKAVWDRLGDMLRNAGDVRPAGAPAALPDGRPTVRLDDAMKLIAPQLPVEVKRQNERFRLAITNLMNAGRIEHMEGWLWIK